MSDHYRLNFHFGIDPYGPPEWVEIFKALARNEAPDDDDLATLPPMLAEYLASPGMLGVGNMHATIGSPVFMAWHGESAESEYWPKSPEWEVQFSISMHDDWYGNGAYLMWMQMVEIVGDNGLYCTVFTEGQKDTMTLYYKENEDILSVRIGAPFTSVRVPPGFPKSREELSPHFKPAEAPDFSIETVVRIPPAMRAEAMASIEAMYRAEGWMDGDE